MATVIRYQTIVLDDIKAGTKPVVTKICSHCGGHTTFLARFDSLDRWRNGILVQHVWPDVPIAERETLVSGLHAECWDELFKEDEDERIIHDCPNCGGH